LEQFEEHTQVAKAMKTRAQHATEACDAVRAAVLNAWDAALARKTTNEGLLTHEQLIREIEGEIELTNQRQYALAHGITPQQLNQALHGTQRISAEMAEKLGYEMKVLFAKKGKGK
jgi:hypothetical protein